MSDIITVEVTESSDTLHVIVSVDPDDIIEVTVDSNVEELYLLVD